MTSGFHSEGEENLSDTAVGFSLLKALLFSLITTPTGLTTWGDLVPHMVILLMFLNCTCLYLNTKDLIFVLIIFFGKMCLQFVK